MRAEKRSAAAPTTRAERKARTRQEVLNAARAVVAERGMEGASLEEIASRAGVTIGAVYSNFEGKADLMISLLNEHAEEDHIPPLRGESLAAALADLGRFSVALADEQPDQCLLSLEFLLYALRDPSVRAQRLPQRAAMHAKATDQVQRFLREHDVDLPIAPWQFVEVLSLVLWSLAQSRLLLGPDLISERFCVDLVSMLGGVPPQADAEREADR